MKPERWKKKVNTVSRNRKFERKGRIKILDVSFTKQKQRKKKKGKKIIKNKNQNA